MPPGTFSLVRWPVITLHVFWDGEPHSFDLQDGEYTVGRSGDVRIPKEQVSKKHARLRVAGQRLFVTDLGSRNGTRINGVTLGDEETEAPLDAELHFAQVRALRFLDSTPAGPLLLSDGSDIWTRDSYHPAQGYSGAAATRIVDMLSLLFELVGSNMDTETLESAACEFVSRCVEADRVVLLEDAGPGSPLVPGARWVRGEDRDERLRLSSVVVNLVRQERQSVLIEDATRDPRTRESASVLDLRLRTAMAAPLFDNERVRGILYVDSRAPSARYTVDDLQVLTATANAVAVKLRASALEEGLRIAADIQRKMLPVALCVSPDYEMHAHQEMCLAVGGDLYHCLMRPNGTQLVALGDVAGKGMPAALAMSNTMGRLHALSGVTGTLEELTQHLHRQLIEGLPPEQYLTLFLGELDRDSGRLRYANQGQEYPILVRAGGKVQKLESTGPPLALLDPIEVRTAEVRLEPGDLLAIFSDGIPEATLDGSTYFGFETLEAILTRHRRAPLDEIAEHVVAAVNDFIGGGVHSDDLTLLLLRRRG